MNAIEVHNLSKKFTHYPSQRDRLIDMATGGRAKRGTDFWALKDISFDVPQGTTFGIIGQNGSGKSTLLSILAGVLQPTSGMFTVNGKVAAILELGSGFHHEFTGRENVYMYGTILGLSRQEINRRFDEIVDFAELHEFIDRPLYTYSSGMVVRLAFATAVNVDANVLIVDEALAVGDIFFQAKCTIRMKKMINDGLTLLFVSHDMGAIKSLCEKSILLNSGVQILYDISDKVVEKYFSMKVEAAQMFLGNNQNLSIKKDDINTFSIYNQKFNDNNKFQKKASYQRIQNGKARFVNVQLLNEDKREVFTVEYDQAIILRMIIEVLDIIPILTFGYHIRDKNGIDIIYSDSNIEQNNIVATAPNDHYIVDWRFKTSLMQGAYNIACVLSIPTDVQAGLADFCDFIPIALQFNVSRSRNAPLYGAVHISNLVEISKK